MRWTRRHPLADAVGLHRVQVARRKAELLRKAVLVGLRRDALVDERRELAGLIGGDRDALPRRRTPADEAEYAFAGERDADGPAGHARRHHAELVVEPQRALAAEPAADERRPQRHVLALQSEDVRETAGAAGRELARVVHGDAVVAGPDGNRRMRLDRVVVVRGRGERQIHGVRRRLQRSIRIAVNDLRRFAQHVFRRLRLRDRGFERGHRLFRRVGDAHQGCGVGGPLFRIGDDHSDRLAVPGDAIRVEDLHGCASRGWFALRRQRRGHLHGRRIQVGDDRDDPGRLLRLRGLDAFDDALRDRAAHDRRMHEALDLILSGEPSRAGDLLDTVEAIDGLAEIAMASAQLVLIPIAASPARSARPPV